MPFGLTNAPASFQKLADSIFADLINKWMKVYLDDLLVHSETLEDHLRHLEIVLSRLEKEGLKASLEKTTWAALRVAYLGYILSKDGIIMDPAKIQAVLDIPTPDKVVTATSRPKY